ncbi:MAG TPA: hypothetical protein DDX11_01465 [Candidatus Peribacter riflensis]|nr:hypothetical protein [Candidatus Peribacter riflensis]
MIFVFLRSDVIDAAQAILARHQQCAGGGIMREFCILSYASIPQFSSRWPEPRIQCDKKITIFGRPVFIHQFHWKLLRRAGMFVIECV